jgi:starvation-inducible DNA-binding protein
MDMAQAGLKEVLKQSGAVTALAEALNGVLADTFTLYLKTKNFHWHVSGPHFRDYHLLFDEQAAQHLATTDLIAERVRKIGRTTLRSIGHVLRLRSLHDSDLSFVPPAAMLAELEADNRRLAHAMREAHLVAGSQGDVATTSLLEVWIDEADQRAWFLAEAAKSV